jgi:acyl-CoA thioesterase
VTGAVEGAATFEAATRVVGGGEHWRAVLDDGFRTPAGPFGGYLAAIALRAAAAATSAVRPSSFACQFLNVGEPGPVELSVSTLRASSLAEALHVSMRQGNDTLLAGHAWFVNERRGIDHGPAGVPAVPRPSLLAPFESLHEGFEAFPFVEGRPVYAPPLARPCPPGPPFPVFGQPDLVGGPEASSLGLWLRMRPQATHPDLAVDAARALVAFDWVPPYLASIRHAASRVVLPTTLSLAVDFHDGAPSSAWLYCAAAAEVARHGVAHGSGTLWSEDGRLVATGMLQIAQRVRL